MRTTPHTICYRCRRSAEVLEAQGIRIEPNGYCEECRREYVRSHKKTFTECYRCHKSAEDIAAAGGKFYQNGYCNTCGAAYYRERHAEQPELNKASHKRYYKKHRTKVLGEAKAYNRKFREEVLGHYGGRCACCGENRYEFLALDHVNGDGGEHRRSLGIKKTQGGGGLIVYRFAKKHGYPPTFRCLCHNCNMARGIYGYCPHEKEAKVSTTEST